MWTNRLNAFVWDHRGYTGTNPNANPICNKNVHVTCKATISHWQHFLSSHSPINVSLPFIPCSVDGGKTITVRITDRCTGCAYGDLDLSPSAFTNFAPLATGRLHGMTWVYA